MDVAVIGAGESGTGAALLAAQKGLKVWLSENGNIGEEDKSSLAEQGVRYEECGHTMDPILQAKEVIKSPGVPNEAPVVQEVMAKKGGWIDEIEFASRYTQARLIGVTGTNGKTTCSFLIHHLFQKAGYDVRIAGNMGVSFARQLCEEDHDYFVLELSSFQLEGIRSFRPDMAVILNITPDHLERHGGSMEEYVRAKFRITENQTEADFLVANVDDPEIREMLQKETPRARMLPISGSEKLENGASIENEKLITNIDQKGFTMSIHQLALKGQHNNYNSMAASVAARVFEIRKEVVRESLADFQNAPHRLEFVANVHGITFSNDSKATNVNATWYALESADAPVIWVVGGVDKGNDYSSLQSLVRDKVKAIICLTSDPDKIREAFGDVVDTIVEAQSAVEAVGYGYRLGRKGDTVLLSPACASFDLFEDYEDRGEQFKSAVRAL